MTSKSDWSSEEVGDATEIENDKTKQIWTAAQAAIKFKPKFEKDGWEGLDSRDTDIIMEICASLRGIFKEDINP